MADFVAQFNTLIGVIVFVVFLVLLMLETRFSLRHAKRSKPKRFLINIGVSGLALATGAYVVAPVVLSLASRNSDGSFGLLHVIALPFSAEFILGFLLMDLTFYYWHRANHAFRFFWRFHNVHHVDPDLDVSTSFRFHFGEVLYSVGFRALQIYLLGIGLFTYFIYELTFQSATMFHHSNVRLPITVERWLNKIVVTPRMHGIHHSILKYETDSNYSVIFRWWDLIHGTLRLNVRQSDLVIGVPAYLAPEDNKFSNLLVLPFRPQRDYWHLPGRDEPVRGVVKESENILLP
ncbi:MAG TPA: sterol desaturase family protein [Candidatus Binatia bacterium]|nr:sterol desaturase family protein [Candidatus Binatia bacterium]